MNFKPKKAFTLIELLVVMGILAVILSLSTIGLVNFKASIDLNFAYEDFKSVLTSLRNDAINSKTYTNPEEVPDFIFLSFQNGFIHEACFRNVGGFLNCNNVNDRIINFNSQISVENTCQVIGFQRRPPQIFTTKEIENQSSNINCQMIFRHTNIPGSGKIIRIQPLINIIEYD